MRKIDEKAYHAFMNRRRFKSRNTEVTVDGGGKVHMYLFGNEIAKRGEDGIFISDGNYHATPTTRSRLSMFVNISIYKGDFIINNKIKWDGQWTNINHFN